MVRGCRAGRFGSNDVVHAAAHAELDPAHAQRVVGITGDGDQGLIALQACQAFVLGLSRFYDQHGNRDVPDFLQ